MDFSDNTFQVNVLDSTNFNPKNFLSNRNEDQDKMQLPEFSEIMID